MRVKARKFRRAGGAAVLMLACAGCAPESGGVSFLGEPERAFTTGDWDDVDAAVVDAVSKKGVEMAVVASHDPEAGTRVYELTTVGDEPARLVVRRKVAGVSPGARHGRGAPEAIGLEAWVGRFGDRERERALIAAVRARLGDLSGVDFAPLK